MCVYVKSQIATSSRHVAPQAGAVPKSDQDAERQSSQYQKSPVQKASFEDPESATASATAYSPDHQKSHQDRTTTPPVGKTILQDMTPRYCNTGRKTSKVLDCYGGFNDKSLGESYWVEPEHPTVDLQQEINQAEKHDSKKKSETQHEDVKASKDRSYDLRYRPNIHPPDRYTDPGQYPILIKGTLGRAARWCGG